MHSYAVGKTANGRTFKQLTMSLQEKVSLIIYRFRERGLEIFVLPEDEAEQALRFPQGPSGYNAQPADQGEGEQMIRLEAVKEEGGSHESAMAVEGDWHEIPSLKRMLYEDALQLKEKLKELDNGAYLSMKEALRRALPHQYQFLKELKDILVDRNSVRDL